MDQKTLILAIMSLIGWGVGSFIAKLATNRIGEKTVFWDLAGYVPMVIIYCLFLFRSKELFSADKNGIILGLIAGLLGSIGVISFYILLTRKDASSAVPMTALYPMLTAILAIIFLKESLTLVKAVGIVLSVVALVLLSL